MEACIGQKKDLGSMHVCMYVCMYVYPGGKLPPLSPLLTHDEILK